MRRRKNMCYLRYVKRYATVYNWFKTYVPWEFFFFFETPMVFRSTLKDKIKQNLRNCFHEESH